MTRAEHVQWCKTRALQYLDAGDPLQAVTSMCSDMDKHAEAKVHPMIFMIGLKYAGDCDTGQVRAWIKGFTE
jgi:hypothetical protein